MKYSLDWLLAQDEQQESLKYIFFWGHQPRKDHQIAEKNLLGFALMEVRNQLR